MKQFKALFSQVVKSMNYVISGLDATCEMLASGQFKFPKMASASLKRPLLGQ